MRVKNWDRFQHFKNRNPPWIKFYNNLLDDPEWHALDPLAWKVLSALWLIASKHDYKKGHLPDIKKISFRLRMPESLIQSIISEHLSSHWLLDDIKKISKGYQCDAPESDSSDNSETDSSDNSESDRLRTNGHGVLHELEQFQLTPELLSWAESEHITNPAKYLPEFKDYWKSVGGKRKNGPVKDWPSTWRNHMRRLKADGKLQDDVWT